MHLIVQISAAEFDKGMRDYIERKERWLASQIPANQKSDTIINFLTVPKLLSVVSEESHEQLSKCLLIARSEIIIKRCVPI